MLGLPVAAWLWFFSGAFVAGACLLLLSFKPMGFLAAFVMSAAAAGLALVVLYLRSYDSRSWRRLAVRPRRRLRAWRRRRDIGCHRVRVVPDPWRSAAASPELGGRGPGATT